MSEVIRVPLSTAGINSLIRQLEKRKEMVSSKVSVFLDTLAQEGLNIASAKFSEAVYDGTNDVSVSAEARGNNARAVVAIGNAALFIEFGTGVTYPDDHPEAAELGMRRGEYGKGHGRQSSWGYYGEPGTNGIVREKANGGSVVITHGNPANMPMYETVKELESRLGEIAREVFS